MSVYRNTGAKWTRPDGTVIERGDEFVPTDEEKLRRAYKLAYVRPLDGMGDDRDLSDFETGNGWYLIGGEKVHGREAALEALEDWRAKEQHHYRLHGGR